MATMSKTRRAVRRTKHLAQRFGGYVDRRRLGRWLVYVYLIGFAMTSCAIAWTVWLQRDIETPSGASRGGANDFVKRVRLRLFEETALSDQRARAGYARLRIDLRVNSFDPTTGLIDALLTASYSRAAYKRANPLTPPPGTISILMDDELLRTRDIRLRMSRDLTKSSLLSGSTVLALRAWGTPQAYPYDRYVLDSLFVVDAFGLDPVITAATGPSLRAYNVVAWRTHSGNQLSWSLERPRTTRWWTLLICLAPILAIGSAWLLGHRSQLGVDVVLAGVSLLALRQVLVPGDIAGLTLVDICLGVQIVLLLAFVVFFSRLHSGSEQ
jgi:hypothetical protein